MATGSPELRYGRIVWARLKDRNGLRKERPGIILTPTDQISRDQPLVIVCVTTRFADPSPPNHLPLPWNNNPKKVGTRLAHRSAEEVDWLDTLYPDEVIQFGGDVPTVLMHEIQARIRQIGRSDVREFKPES